MSYKIVKKGMPFDIGTVVSDELGDKWVTMYVEPHVVKLSEESPKIAVKPEPVVKKEEPKPVVPEVKPNSGLFGRGKKK